MNAARVTRPDLSLEIAEFQQQDASSGEFWDQEKDPQASWERIENGDWLVSGILRQWGCMGWFESSHSTTISIVGLFDQHTQRSAAANLQSLTCRKRHKKCDEKRPVCGPCSISSRECLYASIGTSPSTSSIERPQLVQRCHRRVSSGEHGARVTNEGSSSPTYAVTSLNGVPDLERHASSLHSCVTVGESGIASDDGITAGVQGAGGQVSFEHASQIQAVYNTPETILSEYLTTGLASTRWLDLLAADAAQADKGFSLPPTRHPSPAQDDLNSAYDASQTNLQDLHAAVPHAQAQIGLSQTGGGEVQGLNQAVQPNDIPSINANEKNAWQLEQNICLQDHEVELFRRFAEGAAQWLDLFDPFKHFSTHATRLAVRLSVYLRADLLST